MRLSESIYSLSKKGKNRFWLASESFLLRDYMRMKVGQNLIFNLGLWVEHEMREWVVGVLSFYDKHVKIFLTHTISTPSP